MCGFKSTLRSSRILKDARIKKKHSQHELSELTGIPQTRITRRERGIHSESKLSDLKILAQHLDLPLEPLTTLVVHEIETRRRTRLSIACIASILEIAVLMMTSDEQKETVCRIGKRIQLFAEDSEQLGNNIALFLTGNLKLDEEPKNGLRPLRHYICPITQDIEDWKNLELHEVQVPYKFDEIPEDGGHE